MALRLDQLYWNRITGAQVGIQQTLFTVAAGTAILIRTLSLWNSASGTAVCTFNLGASGGIVRGYKRYDVLTQSPGGSSVYDMLEAGQSLLFVFALLSGAGPVDVLVTGSRFTVP